MAKKSSGNPNPRKQRAAQKKKRWSKRIARGQSPQQVIPKNATSRD